MFQSLPSPSQLMKSVPIMRLITGLPEDLLADILNEWISIHDIGLLDIACTCSGQREYFLVAIQRMDIGSNFGVKLYEWTNLRHIKIRCLYLNKYSFVFDSLRFEIYTNVIIDINIVLMKVSLVPALVNIVNSCYKLQSLRYSSFSITEVDFFASITILHQIKLLQHHDVVIRRRENLTDTLHTICCKCCNLQSISLYYETSVSYVPYYETILRNNVNLVEVNIHGELPVSLVERCCPKIERFSLHTRIFQFLDIISLIVNCPINFLAVSTFLNSIKYKIVDGKKHFTFDNIATYITVDKLILCFESITNIAHAILNIYQLPDIFILNNANTLESLDVRLRTPLNLTFLLEQCTLLKVLQMFRKALPADTTEIFEEIKPKNIHRLALTRMSLSSVLVVIGSCVNLHTLTASVFTPTLNEVNAFKSYVRECDRSVDYEIHIRKQLNECCLNYSGNCFTGLNIDEYLTPEEILVNSNSEIVIY